MPDVKYDKINCVTSKKTLFRHEVLIGHNSSQLGQIRLSQPISSVMIATVAMLIATLLFSLITFGSIDRKVRVSGLTVPIGGSHTIMAPNAGILSKIFVSEGDHIKAGMPIFEISSERHSEQGELTFLLAQQLHTRELALASERETQNIQYKNKLTVTKAKHENLTTQLNQIDQEIALAQKRKDLAEKNLKNFELLQSSGYVSLFQVQQKQDEFLDGESRLATLKRIKIQAAAERIRLDAEIEELANILSAALIQIDRNESSLKQEIVENTNRKSTKVLATHDGVVAMIALQLGQAVVSSQSLGTLIPTTSTQNSSESPLYVHLYAPSRTTGFVSAGQSVLIRYQAYPYQKFGLHHGHIVDVSRTPLAQNELPTNLAGSIISGAQQSGFNGGEALYRIRVAVDKQAITAFGKEYPLKPGMAVDADILQENRKIWEWILEPVLAATNR